LGNGFLNPLDRQRRLVRSIIEIRHLAIGPQSLQGSAEPWRAVWVCRSAQGHDVPEKLRMGQYVAAAPQRFVVGMGDDNSGPGPRGQL
jgi:hypothetical protein